MRARKLVVMALVAAALAAPFAPARAASPGGAAESRVGVVLMVACGLSLRVARIAPVPFAGIAALSCAFGLLDALLSSD
jgi:hypothetical protein